MALKICSFNYKGFNVSKVKHIENVLKQCDLLLLQEIWPIPRDVGNIFLSIIHLGSLLLMMMLFLLAVRTVVAHFCTENRYHQTLVK